MLQHLLCTQYLFISKQVIVYVLVTGTDTGAWLHRHSQALAQILSS
jgi:hypothetical protein